MRKTSETNPELRCAIALSASKFLLETGAIQANAFALIQNCFVSKFVLKRPFHQAFSDSRSHLSNKLSEVN